MSATTTNLDATIESVSPDNESVADRAASAAHGIVDNLADKACDAEVAIRSAASDSTQAVEQKYEDAKEELEVLTDKAKHYARKNPLQSAGIAFGAGILVSLLLRR